MASLDYAIHDIGIDDERPFGRMRFGFYFSSGSPVFGDDDDDDERPLKIFYLRFQKGKKREHKT